MRKSKMGNKRSAIGKTGEKPSLSFDVEQRVFLDESGATTQMTQLRAPRGQRVNKATPLRDGKS
jgi:hypothetical protein